MITINSSTRQFNIPGADLVFGVTADAGSVTKEFSCPRYVGNNLDLTGCFIRMNYQNANGEIDSYLVTDIAVDGDNIVFGWELSPKVTMYKGNVSFVMCVTGPDTKIKWHTTLGRGQVLEGLEPDWESVMGETVDVVAQLIAMVEAQTEAVANTGAEWVRNVQSEGTDQIIAVQTAARESREAAVAEIEAKGVNVRESIPDDYTALSEAVDGLVRGRAGAIVCEAAGSAITVNDASDLPMQGMKIFGRSTQDGTPTPDAPVEIVSVVEPVVTVAGKNLLNSDYFLSEMFTKVENGYKFARTGDSVSSAICPLNLPKGRYVLSWDIAENNGVSCRLYVGLLDGTVKTMGMGIGTNNNLVLDYDTGIKDMRLSFYSTVEVGAYVVFSHLQLEVGSEATAYEPHKTLQTIELTHTLPGIPVTSGGNYTDSDGQQWICDEVDLERGVYVQNTWYSAFDGSADESWSLQSINEHGIANFSASNHPNLLGKDGICNRLESQRSVIASTETEGIMFNRGSVYLRLFSSRCATVEELREWLSANPVVCVGFAVAPIETALSETEIAAYRALHSNYPNTTVLNDAGAHMVVKYAADTKLYIDNKIAALVGG